MWTATEMSIPVSFVVSLMGLSIVMATLMSLAVAVLIFSKIMERRNAAGATAVRSSGTPAEAEPEVTAEVCSMILAVICEELHAAPEEISVKSIRKIGKG